MSLLKIVNKGFFLLLIGFITFNKSNGQKTSKEDQKKAEIQNLIESKNYDFVAQSMLPLSGRLINLTTYYDMKVKGDSLVSDLPYFGRAYVAPINPDEGGVHFTSTNFNYTNTKGKKGGWNISMEPKDTKDIRQLFLTVSETGFASLQVTSNNKQSISYNGYITAIKQK